MYASFICVPTSSNVYNDTYSRNRHPRLTNQSIGVVDESLRRLPDRLRLVFEIMGLE